MSSPTFLMVCVGDFGEVAAFGIGAHFVLETPDFGEEAGDPFDAFHGPGFDLFERAHKHFVESQ